MAHLVSLLLLAAALPASSSYTADPAVSAIHYVIVHKLHQVDAVSHEVEGKAVVRDDGTVLAMVRVPVASFRSGDGNRDGHMLEAVEAGRYPFVVFKGVAQLGPSRELPPGPLEIRGEVDFHGVTTPALVRLDVSPQPDGSLRARGTFEVSLDAHHVERPSLLFVKIDDACRIQLDLLLRGVR